MIIKNKLTKIWLSKPHNLGSAFTTQRPSAIRRRCVASLRLSRRRIAASRDV